MNRLTQSMILVLLGGAVLRISLLSTTYLNYVKPGFRPFLVAAGVVVLALGLAGLVQEWRGAARPVPEDGHDTREHGQDSHGRELDTHGQDRRELELDTRGREQDGREHGEDTHGHGQDRRERELGTLEHGQDGREHGRGAHGHGEDGHGHGHGHMPRVAWLLCLPVFAIFLIAPPALGAFAARSEEAPARPPEAALDAYQPLAADQVTSMPLGEFIGRAWGDSNHSLAGKQVRLTGFVVPSKKKDRWYVARIQIACCAADGIPLKVAVLGATRPPAETWVEVTGTWIQPKSDDLPNGTIAPELTASSVEEIPAPVEPYE
ncbi:TIGR03943 family putative permease subunit [Acrocarpospora catenulata]|uniref:TIGR03943 family putative permease subunit n=1 Tax=Acrocarpospora catenulata TaxID=2836182 RepID=UPI001BD94739|nr:TIGR03943 family protein [Acrocarpospora catenulata]